MYSVFGPHLSQNDSELVKTCIQFLVHIYHGMSKDLYTVLVPVSTAQKASLYGRMSL